MNQSSRGAGRWWSFLLGLAIASTVAAVPARAANQEAWDAIFLNGAKIGYIHTFIEPVKDRERDLLRVRVDTILKLKRRDDQVTMKLQYGTIETLEGSVLRLDTLTQASNQEMRVFGDVINGEMNLKLDVGNQRQQQKIAWGTDVRGPYAVEQSLSRQKIQPGESRDLKMYIPDLNAICDITITAKDLEETVLGDGTRRRLLKIEQTAKHKGKPRPELNSTHWVDESGQVLKTLTPLLGGLITYRTTREGALAESDKAHFDQITNSIVKTRRPIPNPETTRSLRYRLTLKDSDPAQVFPTDRRQTIHPGFDRSTVLLDVKTAGPLEGDPGPESVDEQYTRANALVDSEDATIRRLMNRAIGNATDPWEKAVKINHWVAENLREKNFSTAFASASEVARDLTGDCTEHGVLSAAMCRAAGIPARVAIGLVYAQNLGGFGYHLWNEVYVSRRWVAIDAAFDQSEVDAVHIKLTDSSLEGVSPFEAFLPVIQVLGKLSLEPLEIR